MPLKRLDKYSLIDIILNCCGHCSDLPPVFLWQVQPDVGDADYGSTKQQRGRLLYSLEHNASLSEVEHLFLLSFFEISRCRSITLMNKLRSSVFSVHSGDQTSKQPEGHGPGGQFRPIRSSLHSP